MLPADLDPFLSSSGFGLAIRIGEATITGILDKPHASHFKVTGSRPRVLVSTSELPADLAHGSTLWIGYQHFTVVKVAPMTDHTTILHLKEGLTAHGIFFRLLLPVDIGVTLDEYAYAGTFPIDSIIMLPNHSNLGTLGASGAVDAIDAKTIVTGHEWTPGTGFYKVANPVDLGTGWPDDYELLVRLPVGSVLLLPYLRALEALVSAGDLIPLEPS